jgi:hypothetical protein
MGDIYHPYNGYTGKSPGARAGKKEFIACANALKDGMLEKP